MELKKQKMK